MGAPTWAWWTGGREGLTGHDGDHEPRAGPAEGAEGRRGRHGGRAGLKAAPAGPVSARLAAGSAWHRGCLLGEETSGRVSSILLVYAASLSCSVSDLDGKVVVRKPPRGHHTRPAQSRGERVQGAPSPSSPSSTVPCPRPPGAWGGRDGVTRGKRLCLQLSQPASSGSPVLSSSASRTVIS